MPESLKRHLSESKANLSKPLTEEELAVEPGVKPKDQELKRIFIEAQRRRTTRQFVERAVDIEEEMYEVIEAVASPTIILVGTLEAKVNLNSPDVT